MATPTGFSPAIRGSSPRAAPTEGTRGAWAGTHGGEILCIGSVLWDVIGRTDLEMRVGSDVPGQILRQPGGVVLNIAMTLKRFGMRPILLSALGRDLEGDELIDLCTARGLEMKYVFRSAELPTDQYMAIEAPNGLIAAIADAHSLEAAGDRILTPLADGRLGRSDAPYSGLIALDGNLTTELLEEIAGDPAFSAADLRVAPASPGKAKRLLPLSRCPNATLYVNLEEAGILLNAPQTSAKDAGAALVDQGASRVLVTNGDNETADCTAAGTRTASPPKVTVRHLTGAGDTFMAAHIAAEARGARPEDALATALDAAAAYVSGATPP